jgi:GT2 family glycosyltransferase
MKYSEKIGIVTVLYKSESVLHDFFTTLNQQTYDNFILYVIDNKSPDSSLASSKQLSVNSFFEVKFIENDDNYGVAKGNNQGIEAALIDGCDYVLLSNNDVVLKPDTIEKLYAGLKETNADIVVPKIYFHGTNCDSKYFLF